MFNIECPYCLKDQEVDGADLSSHACDNTDYECNDCGEVFEVGWYANIELRDYDEYNRV